MRYSVLVAALVLAIAWSGPAMAHAFPEHSVPGAGETLTAAPAVVTIYFDSELEPIFSKLVVKNEQGVQVSQGNGSIDPKNQMVLETRLAAKAKGSYHVFWSVVSRDGHRTEGDYSFSVQ
jgi:copper resistance protein C